MTYYSGIYGPHMVMNNNIGGSIWSEALRESKINKPRLSQAKRFEDARRIVNKKKRHIKNTYISKNESDSDDENNNIIYKKNIKSKVYIPTKQDIDNLRNQYEYCDLSKKLLQCQKDSEQSYTIEEPFKQATFTQYDVQPRRKAFLDILETPSLEPIGDVNDIPEAPPLEPIGDVNEYIDLPIEELLESDEEEYDIPESDEEDDDIPEAPPLDILPEIIPIPASLEPIQQEKPLQIPLVEEPNRQNFTADVLQRQQQRLRNAQERKLAESKQREIPDRPTVQSLQAQIQRLRPTRVNEEKKQQKETETPSLMNVIEKKMETMRSGLDNNEGNNDDIGEFGEGIFGGANETTYYSNSPLRFEYNDPYLYHQLFLRMQLAHPYGHETLKRNYIGNSSSDSV